MKVGCWPANGGNGGGGNGGNGGHDHRTTVFHHHGGGYGGYGGHCQGSTDYHHRGGHVQELSEETKGASEAGAEQKGEAAIMQQASIDVTANKARG